MIIIQLSVRDYLLIILYSILEYFKISYILAYSDNDSSDSVNIDFP